MTDAQKTAIEQIMDEIIIDISYTVGSNKYEEALKQSEILKNLAIACAPDITILNADADMDTEVTEDNT